MQSFHCSTFWRWCCSRSCCCRHRCSCCCCCSRSCCCRHSCSSCCYCSCCCCCCCCCCCFLRNEIFKNFCLRGFPKIAPKSFLAKFFLQQQKSNFYATNVKNVTDGCTSWVILRRFTLCLKCNQLFLKSVDRKYPNIFALTQNVKPTLHFKDYHRPTVNIKNKWSLSSTFEWLKLKRWCNLVIRRVWHWSRVLTYVAAVLG